MSFFIAAKDCGNPKKGQPRCNVTHCRLYAYTKEKNGFCKGNSPDQWGACRNQSCQYFECDLSYHDESAPPIDGCRLLFTAHENANCSYPELFIPDLDAIDYHPWLQRWVKNQVPEIQAVIDCYRKARGK